MREEKNDMAPYSLNDIEQYLLGKLPPAEMHAIERAALQDPFLADAIEGYRTNGTAFAHEDISSVHDQLPTYEKVKIKWKPSSVTGNTWWQAAAAIILVAGATILGWHLLKSDASKQELAQNKPVVVQQKTDSFKPAVIIKPVQAAPSKKRSVPIMPAAAQFPPVIADAETPLEDRIIVGKKLTPEETEKRKRENSLGADRDLAAEVVTAKKFFGDDPRLERNRGITVMKSDTLMLKPISIKMPDSLMGYVAGVEVKTIGRGLNGAVPFGKSKGKSLSASETTGSQKENADIIFPPMITTRVSEVPKVDSGVFKISFTPLPKNGWTTFNRYISDQVFLSQKDIISDNDSIVVRIRVDKEGIVLGADILHTFNTTWNTRVLRAIKAGPGWIIFSQGKPETFSITISPYK